MANSMTPETMAQAPIQIVKTQAVMPGQARATTPAATSTKARKRWPTTGPASRSKKAHAPCMKASPNARMAKMITTARIVTPGQMMAMMPTAIAKRPRQRNEDDSELNIGGPFFSLSCFGIRRPGSLTRRATRRFHSAPVRISQNHLVRVLVLGLPWQYNGSRAELTSCHGDVNERRTVKA